MVNKVPCNIVGLYKFTYLYLLSYLSGLWNDGIASHVVRCAWERHYQLMGH